MVVDKSKMSVDTLCLFSIRLVGEGEEKLNENQKRSKNKVVKWEKYCGEISFNVRKTEWHGNDQRRKKVLFVSVY